jgi:molybdopterin synthase catalytic subunit
MRRLTLLSQSSLNTSLLTSAVSSPRHGAVVTFSGVVRSVHAGRRVRGITYDCFIPLAEKELSLIVAQAEKKWPVKVSAAHRIGRLRVGETSVFVAAASMHRAEAFEACRFTIEEIKHRLPVWKKEHYDRGDGRWLPGCALGRRKK